MNDMDVKIIKAIEKSINKINDDISYKNAIKVIKSIIDNIEKYVSFDNFDDYVKFLLANSKITLCLDIIIKQNTSGDEFLIQDIKKIYDNEFFYSLLEMYATKKTVKIKEPKLELPANVNFTDDSFNLYYQEIRRYPLLTPEEENYYGKLAHEGNKAAQNKLVESNLRLVISKAIKYQKLNQNIDVLDLVQSGNIGLMRAAELYDYRMGYRFSTYATYWISQGIHQYIKDNSDLIKKPSHVMEQIFKLKKVKSDLFIKLNREPTNEELAKATGFDIKRIKDLLNYQVSTTSLNIKVNNEDDDSEEMEMFVADKDNLENIVIDSVYHDEMLKLINESNLLPREKEIVLYRYGYVTGRVVTLDELAQKYGLTRERIRQIEHSALRKLKYLIKVTDKELYDERMHTKLPLKIKYIPQGKKINNFETTASINNEDKKEQEVKLFKYEYGVNATTPELIEWNQYYRLVRVCLNKFGFIPENFKTKNGISYDDNGIDIYNWLEEQKRAYMFEELTISQSEALLEINVVDDVWIIMFNLMVKYIDFYREYFINNNFRTFNGIDYDHNGLELGVWYNEELKKYVEDKMSKEKVDKFTEIVRIGLRKVRKKD